ncbi:SO2930 family diheme c-type cytochrome [Novosphingobium sp.]|uniref:SO2930 family diheme c-type cytochrome n=1 Tax=Novosphingobium sp. TaxID=1874826 RepID=UPI0025D3AB1C|nr:SO2930 family diheme c-type cytochrome [Novosphingobium sp.]
MRLLLAAFLTLTAACTAKAALHKTSVVNDMAVTAAAFPQTLSEYGFFTDNAAQHPAWGVTPYRLNTPLWSDGTEKLRFVYLPAGSKANAQGDGLLDLPVGAALIKTFKMQGRLIETRVLLHRAGGWTALPYVWNAQQTEAQLALAGTRINLVTPLGQAISYAVPNKNQCKECHATAGVLTPIGPKARNLSTAWLADMHAAGRLDAVPAAGRRIPLWEDRAKVPVADTARGWLDVNCAHCHKPGGAASNSGLYLGWEVADPAALGVGKRPVAAGRGAGDLAFGVVPGDPDHSILVFRMASLEGGVAMPELGRATVDPDGLAAVRAWITAMR